MLKIKIDEINTEKENVKKQENELKSKQPTSYKNAKMDPILRVVTNTTFIRGVLGILKRVI